MNLTEGTYRAKPVHAVLGKSGTGTDNVEVVFAFYDGAELSHVERSAWFYLSPAAFDRSIANLRTCGWKGDDLSDLSSISAETSPDVRLTLGEEEYKGKLRLKIKFVDEWRERPAVDPIDAKSFAEAMRAKVREADSRNKQKNGEKAPF